MKLYIDAEGVWLDSQGPFDPVTLAREISQVSIAIAKGDITEFEMGLDPVHETANDDEEPTDAA